MSEKQEVANITEAYKQIVVNEFNSISPGEGRSMSPAPQHAETIAIKNEDESNELPNTDVETEGDMAKGELYKLHKDSKDLYNLIGSCGELEPWIFSKITIAASYIQGVKNYLEYDSFKKKGEFNVDTAGHGDMVSMKVKEMLNGESREVLETVLRQAIFNLEALETLKEVKQ
jgi:hypothetical protein